MVTAQQQSLALSALRVSTCTLELNVPIFAPIGAVPGQGLSGFSRVLSKSGVEAVVSMEMDVLDDDEAAGVDSMTPITFTSDCAHAAIDPHWRGDFTDNGMVTFASEYIVANFDSSQKVWKKVGGHARGSYFTVPFGPPIDPIDSFHVTLVWPLMPLFAALQQEMRKGSAAKALAASSAKWIVCSVHTKPSIESPLTSALRFVFDSLSGIRRCSCIAEVLAGDSVMLFLQGSTAPPGSKSFVKALDDMFKVQPPIMTYELNHMQCLRSLGCKASPPTSLFANFCRHALFLSQESDVARLWAEFVRELRWYWENMDQLPAVCGQPPDHSTGYIEQKLCMLQLCIHRTRIAQQRKKNSAAIALSKTIKRQAFNKDRKSRLTSTTKPKGFVSLSHLVDGSPSPRTSFSSTTAPDDVALARAAAAGSGGADAVGGRGEGQAAGAESGDAEKEPEFEVVDGVAEGSDEESVHTADDRLSGEDSDKGADGNDDDESLAPRVDDSLTLDSPSTAAVSSTAACAAGEGWDSLSPFGDVDAAAAAAEDGSSSGGEGRISQLSLDGLLFHDIPMYEPELQPPSPFTEDTAAQQQQQMQALGVDKGASDARSRMQTVQLHSDMCAFKAANPRAVFADFLRWSFPPSNSQPPSTHHPLNLPSPGTPPGTSSATTSRTTRRRGWNATAAAAAAALVAAAIRTCSDLTCLRVQCRVSVGASACACSRRTTCGTRRGAKASLCLQPIRNQFLTLLKRRRWCPPLPSRPRCRPMSPPSPPQVLHDLENIPPRTLWQELLLTSVASAHHSLSIAAGAQLDCVVSLLDDISSHCCR